MPDFRYRLWSSVSGLLLTLVCSVGLVQAAEPPDSRQVIIAIDPGHSRDASAGGAVSPRGRHEYEYNIEFSRRLARALQRDKALQVILLNPTGEPWGLADRSRAARDAGATLLVSVHHDGAQPQYFSEWRYRGQTLRYSDRFAGYSVFYSQENAAPNDSRRLGESVASRLRATGLVPTAHHAEPIPGEGRDLVRPDIGLYRFDGLGVLRSASMPAILLECGVLVNRDEELLLRSRAHQDRLIRAIVQGVQDFVGESP